MACEVRFLASTLCVIPSALLSQRQKEPISGVLQEVCWCLLQYSCDPPSSCFSSYL